MRFSESRLIDLVLDTGTKISISLSVAGKAFFAIDSEGKLPEKICLHFSDSPPGNQIYHFDAPSKTNAWHLIPDAGLTRFLKDCNIQLGQKLLLRRVGPTDYRLSPIWKPFTFIDLFAGIGGMRLGFESTGGTCLFSSEWDLAAQDTYEANFGDRPMGDITQIGVDLIPPHDILLAGFPCQPFSIIGNRNGFSDTRGTLFFEIERIVRHHLPTAILLENVKQFRTHDHGRTCQTVLDTLHSIGYHTHVTILNALDFGLAQKRERTFIVGFRENIKFKFPSPYCYRPHLDSILEPEGTIAPSLIASKMIQEKRLARLLEQGKEAFYPSIWHENKGGHIGMHPFSCALRHNASYNYLLVNGRRRPTGREMLRLQGYPEAYKIVVDHTSIRAQTGNSVAVPVITAIAAEMCVALRKSELLPEKAHQGLLFAGNNHE